MAVFFDGFNNDPLSVEVKTNTTNEAIPGGGYAKIVAVCKGTGQFFIDDTVALEAGIRTDITASTMETNAGGLKTISIGGTPAYTFSVEDMVTSETFWVPTGTNLKVSVGARYTVILYNKQGN